MPKSFADLDEREILALAISLEEEDSRIYRDFTERLKEQNPEIASVLQSMYEGESSHHERLAEVYQLRFGDHIPLVRRQDVKGFIKRKPIWLNRLLRPRRVINEVMGMEAETRRFYRDASNKVKSAEIRKLLGELADAEEDHQDLLVEKWKEKKKPGGVAAGEQPSK
ncbi:MAG TPA: ferritin family protein [Chthoniobacterales bacterium]|jgi:rubrerythrin|nr:ferritin family protein [Chthoniobacterales bacterium]